MGKINVENTLALLTCFTAGGDVMAYKPKHVVRLFGNKNFVKISVVIDGLSSLLSKCNHKGMLLAKFLPHLVDYRTPSLELTYVITQWREVLLEKLTGLEQVKIFPAFYGPRRFTPAFTRARHMKLS